ncbi:FAD:protein FMN transferase [Actinomyces provencensis]|uniref:FAD:protein FMN transferase n=1 Tax=Actinomyces provencensis TaxID=1720198 RepID=UPI001177F3B6|nr:FAD:protein FMN transferase [Actinomyces provencensis]
MSEGPAARVGTRGDEGGPAAAVPAPGGIDEGGHHWTFEAIGTQWRITTPDPLPERVRSAVSTVIEDYDRAFSRFREDSLVTRMSRAAGTFELPSCAAELLETYERLGDLTHGAVNPLVGASLVHLGYGPDYRLTPLPGHLPAPAWDEVVSREGSRLTTSTPLTLDVGAVGKGQLVDLVVEEVLSHGVPVVLVDAGGDVAGVGPRRRVGLEDPQDPARVIGVVTSAGGAVCGSSTNRRTWAPGVHHVLDARTGRPVRGVQATWAAAPCAMLADAATTALFFEGPTRVSRALGVDALVLGEDRTAAWSGTGERRWEVFA